MNTGFIPSLDGTEEVLEVRENDGIPTEYSYMKSLPRVLNQGNDPICVPCSVAAWLNWKTNAINGVNMDNDISVYDIFDNASESTEGMTCKRAFDYLKTKGVKSDAGLLKISKYYSLKSIYALKYAIVANGPCVIVLPIRDQFRNDFWNGRRTIGFHAVAAVGYDTEGIIIRNSWGDSYGIDGYFHLSYEDFQHCREMWTFV
jgi:hypothetical protein